MLHSTAARPRGQDKSGHALFPVCEQVHGSGRVLYGGVGAVISDKALAGRVSTLMLEASGSLNEAAALIAESSCSEAEKQRLFLAIGAAMGTIGTEVLNEIFRSHPELKPLDFMLPEDYSEEG